MLDIIKNLMQKYIVSLQNVQNGVDDSLADMIFQLKQCRCRIVLCGVGKSAIVAQKISSTMNSLGIQSFFLHATEALHGDFGMLQTGDFVLVLSKSGETQELITLMHYIRLKGNRLFSLTGDTGNTIGKLSDCTYKINLGPEACHMNLAPTTSAVAFMVIGDVISILLSEERGFTPQQYAQLHPGGNLGIRLHLKVKDVMHTAAEIPVVRPGNSIMDCILEMTSKSLGMVNVLDSGENFLGIMTDYDLRKFFEQSQMQTDLRTAKVSGSFNRNSVTTVPEYLAQDAYKLMRAYGVSVLPVVCGCRLVGVVCMQDIIRNGINLSCEALSAIESVEIEKNSHNLERMLPQTELFQTLT